METTRAVVSAWPSAIPFGISSPTTTWVGDQEERDAERHDRCGNRVEDVCENRLAQGTDGQAGDRDAELHRRDESGRVGSDLEHQARATIALISQLGDPRAAGRDERVLGRDEERVQQK